MIEPLISLTILEYQSRFLAGEELRWEFQVDAVENHDIVAVENSILWYTTGKGDEDIGVHFFERRVQRKNEFVDLTTLRRYQKELPCTPLSYDGFLLKINWCVRVRVFLKGGREIAEEIPFEMVARSPKELSQKSTVKHSPLRIVGI